MQNGDKQRGVTVRERKLPPIFAWPEDIERLIDRTMRGFWPHRRLAWPAFWREAGWIPDMDVFERDGKTVLRLDVPGMKSEDIEVAVEGDTLVIRGRREEEKEVKEEDYYCHERATGEFSRALTLPEGVTADDIEATCENGVLEVTIPKVERAEKTTVKVQVK